MVGVHLVVQHIHARHAAHGRDEGLHLCRIPTLGKIRHAFNQSFHRFGFLFFAFLSSGFPQLFGSFGARSGSVGRS